MRSYYRVSGVDPGLVHTGMVLMQFNRPMKAVTVSHEVVEGLDAELVLEQLEVWGSPSTFIEAYRSRSSFNSDQRMIAGIQEMRKLTGARVLDNTGVKKVVKQNLMELLGVWKFPTVTNHQDLRSAARIALLGMMKDEEMNILLADIVDDYLAGNPWSVQS